MSVDCNAALEEMESETAQLKTQLEAAKEQISVLTTEKDEIEAMVADEV